MCVLWMLQGPGVLDDSEGLIDGLRAAGYVIVRESVMAAGNALADMASQLLDSEHTPTLDLTPDSRDECLAVVDAWKKDTP